MRISPTYAGREDLSATLKLRFTIEERIENNLRVRAFYRWYHLKDNYIGPFFFVAGVVPLILGAACDSFTKWLFGNYEWVETLGLIIFVAGLTALSYAMPPVGLGLTGGLTVFVAWLWFMGVMGDYDMKLRRGADEKKWSAIRAKLA